MAIDVTQIIEPTRRALGPVGASLSDAWSAVIGDRIAAWRLKNAASLQVAVNDEIAKLDLQLDRSKIPERYAFAWFEEATKQDETEIQQLFARLLARAVAGDDDAADRRNLEILTHFTPMDAKVLAWFFRECGHPRRYASLSESEAWKGLRGEFGEKSSLSLDHLIALGVLERQFSLRTQGNTYRWETIEAGSRLDRFVDDLSDKLMIDCDLAATSRGVSLYHACIGPEEAGIASRE